MIDDTDRAYRKRKTEGGTRTIEGVAITQGTCTMGQGAGASGAVTMIGSSVSAQSLTLAMWFQIKDLVRTTYDRYTGRHSRRLGHT